MARNPSIQSKLREELLTFGADPTFDQLNNSLPYLDAMVNETLRVHPPVLEITRVVRSRPNTSCIDSYLVTGKRG